MPLPPVPFSNEKRQALRRRAEEALARVRPALQADGGDTEVVDVTAEGRLILRLIGACGGCPMSPQTLKQGIERVIHRDVPDITAVEAR
jgi:Fe-S cluster biogenesis protein NfuA